MKRNSRPCFRRIQGSAPSTCMQAQNVVKHQHFGGKNSIIKLFQLLRGINNLVSLCLQSRSNKSKNKELHSKLFVRLAFNIQGVVTHFSLSLSLSLCSINVMLKSTLFYFISLIHCASRISFSCLVNGYLFQNSIFKIILMMENRCTIKIKLICRLSMTLSSV